METESARILIIDDDKMSQLVLRRNLTQVGYAVETAGDGQTGLGMLAERTYDLVLLDFMLPDMDGYEVFEAMRRDERLRDIPVVIVSGIDEMTSIVTFIEMGVADYLQKPLDPALLRARIGNCMERKRLQDRERRLHRELAEKHRHLTALEAQRDSLANMIVHDLRTPVTALITALGAVGAPDMEGIDRQEMIEICLRSGQTLLRMINDLLDIHSMESGVGDLNPRPVQVSGVVASACEQVAPLATAQGQDLDFRLDEPGLAVLADEGRLARTLVNLLGNAIRVTPRGGRIQLRCGPGPEPGHVQFSLSDTGCGIPPDALSRVFEKFYRIERGDGVASSGLGLTFCQLTVEAHGGRIWVESEPGRGSTFHFTIPSAARS